MPKLIFNFLYFNLRKHHFHRVHLNSLVINCIKGTGTSVVTVQQNNQGYKYLFQRQSAIFLLHGINHSGHRYGAERDQHKSISMSGKPVKPQVLLRLGQQCHLVMKEPVIPKSVLLCGALEAPGMGAGLPATANYGFVCSDGLISLPGYIYLQDQRNLVYLLKGMLKIWITGIHLCEQKWLGLKKKKAWHWNEFLKIWLITQVP